MAQNRRGAPVRPPTRPVEPVRRRSHAAIPVAIAVVALGLYVGRFSVILPALLGLVLLVSVGSFLSTRINPLGVGFYLSVKPSWSAIGVVFLGSMVLFSASYLYFTNGIAPIVPYPFP
jgi:hypothetical protein